MFLLGGPIIILQDIMLRYNLFVINLKLFFFKIFYKNVNLEIKNFKGMDQHIFRSLVSGHGHGHGQGSWSVVMVVVMVSGQWSVVMVMVNSHFSDWK